MPRNPPYEYESPSMRNPKEDNESHKACKQIASTSQLTRETQNVITSLSLSETHTKSTSQLLIESHIANTRTVKQRNLENNLDIEWKKTYESNV